MEERSTERLDGFTDSAFAFAVSLLVVGGGNMGPPDSEDLLRRLADLPAFAVGFAILAMFWHAHVRWRRFRGAGDGASVLLTLTLVFLVLVYVFPLGAMAKSLSALAIGDGRTMTGSVGDLFVVYGIGFLAMSATLAALFANALSNSELAPDRRQAVRGEMIIWSIVAASAVVSTLLAASGGPLQFMAPWVYSALPPVIGLFAWRWRWGG